MSDHIAIRAELADDMAPDIWFVPPLVIPFDRAVPAGAEPPELVGYTTSDETDDVACEYCGDPSTSGVCERHVISEDYASPEVLRGRREHERWENG